MIRDALTQLADGFAPTQGTTTYSTYSYDCGNVDPDREVGTGEPLCLVFSVGVAAAGSTDTTYFEAVSSSSGTDLSTDVKVLASRLIANASLTAGSVHVVPIPPGSVDQRYLGARITMGSGDTVTVDIDLVPQSFVGLYKSYADAVTWS
jgi:hypothetical protein